MIIFIATFLFAKILMSSAGNNATYITCPTTTLADKCHDCIATSVSDLHRPALAPQIVLEILENFFAQKLNITLRGQSSTIDWKYPLKNTKHDRHVNISFYVVDSRNTSSIIQALPGCCSIGIRSEHCSSRQPFSGAVYFSLTLFRVSIVKYFGIHRWSRTSEPEENIFGRQRPFSKNITSETKVVEVGEIEDFNIVDRIDTSFTNIFLPPPKAWEEYINYTMAELFSYVCVFEMPKEQILKASNRSEIESHVFKRDVYEVDGYRYQGNTVYQNCSNSSYEVTCESRELSGSALSELTFEHNNSTLTCMLLWLSMNVTDDGEVRCMEHKASDNQAPPRVGELSDQKIEILVVVFSVIGVFIVTLFIALCIFYSIKKTKKFMKSVQNIPKELMISKSQPNDLDYLEETPRENPVPLDLDELKRIENLRQKQNLERKCLDEHLHSTLEDTNSPNDFGKNTNSISICGETCESPCWDAASKHTTVDSIRSDYCIGDDERDSGISSAGSSMSSNYNKTMNLAPTEVDDSEATSSIKESKNESNINEITNSIELNNKKALPNVYTDQNFIAQNNNSKDTENACRTVKNNTIQVEPNNASSKLSLTKSRISSKKEPKMNFANSSCSCEKISSESDIDSSCNSSSTDEFSDANHLQQSKLGYSSVHDFF